MDFQDAIEQFATMVSVGANALRRLAGSQLGQAEAEELDKTLSTIVGEAERLEKIGKKEKRN